MAAAPSGDKLGVIHLKNRRHALKEVEFASLEPILIWPAAAEANPLISLK